MPASSRGVVGVLALTLQRPEDLHALATPIAAAYCGLSRKTFPVFQGK